MVAYSAIIVGLVLLGNIIAIASAGYDSIWIPFSMVLQTIYLGIAFILLMEFKEPDPIIEKMRIK
jgi:hypothetical protein